MKLANSFPRIFFVFAILSAFAAQAALCNSTAQTTSKNGFLSTTPNTDNKTSSARTPTQDELAGGKWLQTYSQELKAYPIRRNYSAFETVSDELFLTTLFTSDNGYAGNMFDVQVNELLTITRFQINIDTPGSTNTIDIYYRLGTCFGHENSSDGWILLGSDTGVVSNGINNPTPVNIGGLMLEPGQVYGFYVNVASFPSSTMRYTNGGPTTFSNAQMSLTTNCGNAPPAFTGGSFFPRQWNGTIYYTLAVTVTPSDGFVSSGDHGGPFTPSSKTYTLTNTGSNSLDWTAETTAAWLTVSPAAGSLATGTSVEVEVSLNANANLLPQGSYNDNVTFTFTNTTGSSTQTRTVTLAVGSNILAYIQYSDNSASGEYQNTLTAIRSVGTNFTVTEMTNYTQLTTLLPGRNVLLIPEQETTSNSTLQSIGTAWAATLQNFVNNGGVVIVCDFSAGYGILNGAGLMNITSSSMFSDQSVNVIAPDDPVAQGVPSTYTACNGSLYYTTTESSVVVQMPGHGPVVINKEIGLGNVVLIGHDYFASNAQQNRIVGNAVFNLPSFRDNLSVSPVVDFNSSGLQGGPFTPSSKTYTLTNTGPSSLDWAAAATVPWIDLDTSNGTLAPGDSVMIAVSFNANANSLSPGDYNDTVTFTNTTSGFAQHRNVSLKVVAVPGEIDITDSIPPVDDLNMPFGEVFIGLSRTEHITITNTDPTYGLIVTDISLNGGLITSSTSELSVALPAVSNGSSGSYGSYLPASWVSPERAASEVVVRGGYKALSGKIDVLLLASGTDPTILRTGLAAFPDVNTVDYFDASSAVPTPGYLSQYDVVVVMSNNSFANASQTGNALADYVDGGGKVIEAQGSFGTGGGWELAGRFVTDGYEPFIHGSIEPFSHSLGDFDATHPIMEGVTTLTDEIAAGISLKPGAEWVANWNNGTPLVATQNDKVVGINIFAFDYGTFTGDVPLLFHNAVVWLLEHGAEGFSLTNVPALPLTIPPLGNVTCDVVFEPNLIGEYLSSAVIKSNDVDEPEVTVQLSGTAILDYLQIVPQQDFEFSGHPGGPFLPSNKFYWLTNNGPINVNWTVTGAEWFNISPLGGIIKPGETTKVTVAPNSIARSKPKGTYAAQLIFTNQTTTVQHIRNVSLNIYTDPKVWFTPKSIEATVYRGDSEDRILSIGNGGDGLLNFTLRGKQTGFTPASMLLTMASSEPMVETKKDVAAMAPAKHSFTALAANVPFAEGQMLVRFAPQADRTWPGQAAKNSILTKAGNGKLKTAQVTKEYKHVKGLSLVKLPYNVAVKDALVMLNNTPCILYAEPDYQVKALSAEQTIPNDPLFSDLWGLNNTGQSGGTPDADIDAPEAWEIATGTNNIIVAVIDTGVDYTHPDLAPNMWVNTAELNGTPGVDDDGNGYIDDIYGYDFVNNDGNPMDDHYHGTHCAGTIGAVGNNGQGVAGVCWNVKIMALKFLNSSGSGNISDAIECVQYAILMGAKLSSNSWGGGGYSQAFKDAIDAAGSANRLFVAAAGNSSSNNDISPAYPASYTSENIIAVLATDRYDNMSGFSNYGLTSVDIGAPGSDILSCQPGGGYQYLNGTSMATPHVSGAAALVWSLYPSMSYQEVKDILLQTVDKIPSLSGKCVSQGRLNLFNAVNEIGVPWLEFAPQGGSVLSGEVNDVSVLFYGDVPIGTYQGLITVSTNDPYTPEVNIPVTMTVEPLDYFTELFDAGDNDMANRTLTFIPNGSVQYYNLCTEQALAFPVDPAGGTVISLGDDDYYEVQLQDKSVSLYGTSYDTFYIGSNGYITFVSGDTYYLEQLARHFALPRISALFDDLNPAAGGTVSYKILNNRVAVTFDNVPEFSLTSANSFQIEMFFNGKIRITFLNIAAADGLTGISRGDGVPQYFTESNLSIYPQCETYLESDFNKDGNVNLADLAVFANNWLKDNCTLPDWCEGTDLDVSTVVDFHDFAEFTNDWLK